MYNKYYCINNSLKHLFRVFVFIKHEYLGAFMKLMLEDLKMVVGGAGASAVSAGRATGGKVTGKRKHAKKAKKVKALLAIAP